MAGFGVGSGVWATGFAIAIPVFGSMLLAQEPNKARNLDRPSLHAKKAALPRHWHALGLTSDQNNRLSKIKERYRPKIAVARQELEKLDRKLLRARLTGSSKKARKKRDKLARQVKAIRVETEKLAVEMLGKMKEILTPRQKSQLLTREITDRLSFHWHQLDLSDAQLQRLSVILDKYTVAIDAAGAEREEMRRRHDGSASFFFGTTNVMQLRIYQRQMMIYRRKVDDAKERQVELQGKLITEAEGVLTNKQGRLLAKLRNALSVERMEPAGPSNQPHD